VARSSQVTNPVTSPVSSPISNPAFLHQTMPTPSRPLVPHTYPSRSLQLLILSLSYPSPHCIEGTSIAVSPISHPLTLLPITPLYQRYVRCCFPHLSSSHSPTHHPTVPKVHTTQLLSLSIHNFHHTPLYQRYTPHTCYLSVPTQTPSHLKGTHHTNPHRQPPSHSTVPKVHVSPPYSHSLLRSISHLSHPQSI
jgi:hypothetical protein